MHRYNRSVFRKKRTWPRTVGWIVGCVLVIALGFFGAKMINERPAVEKPDKPASSETNTPGKPADNESSSPADVPATKPQESENPSHMRAFYLPFSALRETTALTGQLQQAAQAGFTSVVFDLKNPDGQLYYRFSSPEAQKVNSFAANALTEEELKQLIATIRNAGLHPVPRLYAFRDHAAARALQGARIAPTGNSAWVWYDNNPKNGGRAWLNPYADEAHSYIIQLAQELKQTGVAAIMLDGVQFPVQTSGASYGQSSNTSLSQAEILTLFVDKAQKALGNDCPVILSCTGLGALGVKTHEYGNNPLTFGPDGAAPFILPSSLPKSIRMGETVITNAADSVQQTVQALVSQMNLRIKVIPKDKQPGLIPWLQAENYSAEQIQQEIAGCRAAGTESYILYHPDGRYDFSSLKSAG